MGRRLAVNKHFGRDGFAIIGLADDTSENPHRGGGEIGRHE